MKQLLIALIGFSGCGKSTIAERLNRKYGYVQAKSYTTRPMRNNVNDANTHTFITREQIDEFKDDIVAYNEYSGNAYFVTRKMLEGCNLYVVDREGLKQLKENYHDKEIISIYLDVPPEIAAQRMERRGDSDEAIMQRLQHDAVAFAGAKELCNFVCDNSTQEKMNDICDFIHMLIEYRR